MDKINNEKNKNFLKLNPLPWKICFTYEDEIELVDSNGDRVEFKDGLNVEIININISD